MKNSWKEEGRKLALGISSNHATSVLPPMLVILQGAPVATKGLREGIDVLV